MARQKIHGCHLDQTKTDPLPGDRRKAVAYTDVHIDVLIYLREVLRDHFWDAPQVYVEAD